MCENPMCLKGRKVISLLQRKLLLFFFGGGGGVVNSSKVHFFVPWTPSAQAFLLSEIGSVPWNRVNKILSCLLLFYASHFQINY